VSDAAIVGVYESPRREAKGVHPYAIHAECVRGALEDAGLTFEDVDGLCTATGDWGEGGASSDILDLADYLQLSPRYINSTDFGGGCYVSHAGHSASAIAAHQAGVVVVTYAGCSRHWPLPRIFWDGLTYPAGPGQFEIPYSPTIVSSYALFAQRYMHEYGVKPEHLARIAVACRAHAAKNPHARYREPISIDDVLTSPMIASPLHRLDCCVLTEGGGAFVLAGADRARDCRKSPVWIRGFGEAVSSLSLSRIPERLTTPARESARIAFESAGMTADDIDTAQLYDAFTITALVQLEDLGFCEKGAGGQFIDSGAIDPGGRLPINTDGGGLSSNQPGRRGMFTVLEAVRQVRGESPGSQVANCRTALAHGLGGVMSAGATLIVSRD
jgi:acetyl-CoA C-acetyltransferase